MTDQSLSSAPAEQAAADPIWTRRTGAAAVTLAVLVVLADLLFYPHEPGISFAIFFAALTAGVLALHPAARGDRGTLAFAAMALLAALPFVESANVLWFPFALGAASLLALRVSGQLGAFEDWAGSMVRFTVLAPLRLAGDAVRLLGEAGQQRIGGWLVRLLLVSIVPAVCAAIFLMLFLSANPVLEDLFNAIRLEALFRLLDPARVMVWVFIAVIAWPVLVPRMLRWAPAGAWQGPLQPRAESLVFGGTAIRNSLVAFNALFAVQTLMDLAFLWGGVRLPDGIGYASYAHRGAYPLIVTALLAAAFVLAAMRRNGPGERSVLIRALVYLWIAQNVWLVISSLLRLDLYVEVYSLTEMRIAAGVWMGLVAIGLVLIVVRIALGKSNKWLLASNLASLGLTLYTMSFVDIPATIAAYNVEHSAEMGQVGQPIDLAYMARLGPGVVPALDRFLADASEAPPDKLAAARELRDSLATAAMGSGGDWQSWTWRAERLHAYVQAHPLAPEPGRIDK